MNELILELLEGLELVCMAAVGKPEPAAAIAAQIHEYRLTLERVMAAEKPLA